LNRLALLALLVLAAVASADSGPEHQITEARPIPLGVSGGNINDRDGGFCCGGTIGALVQDSQGVQYVLSNNHVLARTNRAAIGEGVVQPGRIDVNCAALSADLVADLSRFVPISFSSDNQVDAAIGEVRSGAVDSSGTILDVGTLGAGTVAAAVGMSVKKSGRTTGLTSGTIAAVAVTADISYGKKCGPGAGSIARFVNQFRIDSSTFSDSGDSGSLIVENVASNPRAVGLLFAGSSTTTLANPIDAVLSALNVSMVGGGAPAGCSDISQCDDLNACTIDACNAGVCSHTPINCDDGDACTADSCSAGVCSHAAISCDDGNACTTDTCDSGSGCLNTAISGCTANAIVDCVTYTTSGGRDGSKHLNVATTVVDDSDNPLAGASVTISLSRDGSSVGSATATTDGTGRAAFTLSNAADGCYVTDVTSVVASGLTFDGSEPANGFSKGADPTPDADCRSGSTLCGGTPAGSVSPAHSSAQAIERVKAIKRRNEGRLFKITGVVGTGVGLSKNGSPVIEVYLASDDADARSKIPSQIDGVAVSVLVTGPFEAF